MCDDVLPSAGGNAPLWQLEQVFATATCVWFHFEGDQPLTLWQLAQLAEPTGMWVEFLPVALLPLWQLEQLVEAVNVLWSTLAEFHVEVDLWQVSQTVTPLCIGVLGLPTAGGKLPVWQEAHCLATVTEA